MQDRQAAALQDRVEQQASQQRSGRGKQRKKDDCARMGETTSNDQVIIYLRQRQQRRIKRADQNHYRTSDVNRNMNDEITKSPRDGMQPVKHFRNPTPGSPSGQPAWGGAVREGAPALPDAELPTQ